MKKEKIFTNSQYLGFFAYVRNDDGAWKLRVNWLRFIAVGALLAGTAFFGLTTLRYMKYQEAEVDSIDYVDMMGYMFSRETRLKCRNALGDKMIEKALSAKDPGSVIGGIRAGLQLSPNNPDGRIYYSYMMFFQRMYRDACELLAGGLKSALEHPEYPNYFVRRALACTEDEILMKAIDEVLPLCKEKIENYKTEFETLQKKLEVAGGESVPANAELVEELKALKAKYEICVSNQMILQVGLVQSLILRGYFDEASERMKQFNLKNTTTGEVLYAQILWETNDRQGAVDFLNAACERSNDNLQVVLLRAMYLSQMGEKIKARTTLLKAAVQTNDPDIRIRIISMLDTPESQDVWKRLVESFIATYSQKSNPNPAALLALSQYATDSNKFELCERLYKIAEANIYEELPRFELHYMESLIARGDPKKTIEMLEKLNSQNLGWVERNSATLDCLRTMAYYKMGNETAGKLALETTIKNRNISVSQLLIVGKRLGDMGRLEESRLAYNAAYMSENYNQQALLALVNYALENQDTDALFRYLPELLETRRPPRAMLERVRDYLASDRLLFTLKTDDYLEIIEKLLNSKLSKDSDTPQL